MCIRDSYLSEEWIAAADQAVRDADAKNPAPAEGIVVDQFVAGGANYRIRIAKGSSSIRSIGDGGAGEPADASFSQAFETATAVAQGTTDAHQAFLLGHIRFEGNAEILIERRDALEWLEAALAPVIAATSFD